MSGEIVACQIKLHLEIAIYNINAFSWAVLLNDQYKKKNATTIQIVEFFNDRSPNFCKYSQALNRSVC